MSKEQADREGAEGPATPRVPSPLTCGQAFWGDLSPPHTPVHPRMQAAFCIAKSRVSPAYAWNVTSLTEGPSVAPGYLQSPVHTTLPDTLGPIPSTFPPPLSLSSLAARRGNLQRLCSLLSLQKCLRYHLAKKECHFKFTTTNLSLVLGIYSS